MNVDSFIKLAIAGALLALACGCSSTHIQSARHPAGASMAPFRSVMVIGVDQNPDVRQPFENDTAEFLRERGVDAIASYSRLSFEAVKGDKEQLHQQLLAAKAEAVLFVRVTAKADFVDGPPASLGSMDMGAWDESTYTAFTTPGGDINTAYHLGARLYRVSDGAVIWSALLETILKEDADQLAFIRGIARKIVDRMAKDKVIP